MHNVAVHGCKRSATISFAFNNQMTMEETKKDMSHIIDVSHEHLSIFISGHSTADDRTVEYYKNIYPTKCFCVILAACTPKDSVRNFRTIQRLNGAYQPVKNCVVCFENKPNVCNSGCYHDAILCSACASKLKKCPFCERSLIALESI